MRAVFDACVLYPTVLRQVLLRLADNGLLVPIWSARILEEWARAAERNGAGPVARGEIALLRARRPDAERPPADPAGLDLPDPDDRHVLATAIEGRARAIVTFNLRDFPPRALAPHGLRAAHPDDWLMDLWLRAAGPVEAAVEAERAEAERLSGEIQPLRPLLKRAKLPRLAKALS